MIITQNKHIRKAAKSKLQSCKLNILLFKNFNLLFKHKIFIFR